MDQVYSTDNYGSVILDANNEAHVFYGIMMYTDDDLQMRRLVGFQELMD